MKKNPILIILVIINTIGVVLLFISQNSLNEKMIRSSNEFSESTATQVKLIQKETKEGFTLSELKVAPLAINLAKESGPQRYIKIHMAFQIETPSSSRNLEISSKMPTIRDEIVRYLNRKTEQDILKYSGKEVVKNHIIDYSNKVLKKDQVVDIFFTRFEVN